MQGQLHSGFSILGWNFIREKLFNVENWVCFLKKSPSCMKTHYGWLRNESEGPLAFCSSTVYKMWQWLLCLLFSVVVAKWFSSLNLITFFKMKKLSPEESSAHFWLPSGSALPHSTQILWLGQSFQHLLFCKWVSHQELFIALMEAIFSLALHTTINNMPRPSLVRFKTAGSLFWQESVKAGKKQEESRMKETSEEGNYQSHASKFY